ncbi:LysR substrate-binding domain-containing protein [Lichenibacterium dinghuense]|uniref:LysR substrate-binding domain-containing protein n=1 Tax=Lichenibacterium dinghuense TaxID=2895977 RepID=UPI001F1C42D3|nr:LysR substrate-binding domain-containing protein [Lichenibacterium sp. 6Y81]
MDDWLSRDRIRTITTIVEEGSFSRAAARLGVGQSSISQQVRRLEDELGHSLFDRTKRGLGLTEHGESYLMFARAVQGLSESARRHFGQPRAQGPLRLGVAEEFTRTLMMHVLVAFKRAFPKYDVSVTCDTNYRLLTDADEGRYDAVLTKGPIARVRSDVIRRVPLVWVGRPGMTVPVTDPVPLVLAPKPDPFRELTLKTLREAGRSWHVQFETTHLTAMEAAVQAGFGVAAVAKPLPLRGIVHLDDAAGLPPLPDHDLVFLCRTSGSPDEGAEAIRSIIESVYRDLPDSDYKPA